MPFTAYILITLVTALVLAYAYWRLRYGPPAPGQIPILAYHKVDGRFELGGTRVTPAQFARQMRYLKNAGYNAVTLSQAVELMRTGGEAGAKRVCITFDDAYESLFTNAWPVLREYGFPATVFALTDFIGAENTWDINWLGLRFRHLDWGQMKQLQAAGIEFGSHGASHRDLRYLSDAELEREIAGSKQALEQGLGAAVSTFCYPFGRHDARVIAAVQHAGYSAACSLSPQLRNDHIDFFALRRCGVYITDALWDLRCKADQRSPLFWVEDLFTRGVNACAGGTALVKRLAARRTFTKQ